MVESWTRLALDCLFPRSCPPCDEALAPGAVSDLCPTCTAALVAPPPTSCVRCGGTVAAPAAVCSGCLRRPPAFARAVALGPYRADLGSPNVLARTVQCLKYRGHRTLAAPLAELLAAHYPFAPDALLVPVPLHTARLRLQPGAAPGPGTRAPAVAGARSAIAGAHPSHRGARASRRGGATAQRPRRFPHSLRSTARWSLGGADRRRAHHRRHRRRLRAHAARRRRRARRRLHRRAHLLSGL